MKDKFTPQQSKVLLKLARQWHNKLNLHHWQITAVPVPCDEDCKIALDIDRDTDYRRATINVHDNFWKKDNVKYQEQYYVHELIHIILDGYDDAIARLQKGVQFITADRDTLREQTTEHLTMCFLKKDV